MIKKLSFFITLLIITTLLTACSSVNTVGFEGSFWYDAPETGGIEKISEKAVYTVTGISPLETLAPVMDQAGELDMIIDENKSSYTTELTTAENKSYYIYKTTLKISGEYIYGSGRFPIENDLTETEVWFKSFNEGFAPLKVIKSFKNVVPTSMNPQSESDFKLINAQYTIDYDKTAQITFTVPENDEVSKEYLSVQLQTSPVEVKKYNESEYIDNDLLILLGRNFKTDKNFTYACNTIDAVSGKLQRVSISSKQTVNQNESTNNSIDIYPVKISNFSKHYKTNLQSHPSITFNCYGLTFSTAGKNAQTFMYAYYEKSYENQSDNKTNHYPVTIITKGMYRSSYITFNLSYIVIE